MVLRAIRKTHGAYTFSQLLRASCWLLLLDVHLSLVTGRALLVLAVIHHILLVVLTANRRVLLVHGLSSTLLLFLLFALFHGLSEHVGRDYSSKWRVGNSEEVAHR